MYTLAEKNRMATPLWTYIMLFKSKQSISTSKKTTIHNFISAFFFHLFFQALLKKGAKYVVIQGHPMTGCLPLTMTLAPEDDRDDLGCVKSINNQSYIHNVAILNAIKKLKRRFPQAVITYLDYWNAYHTVMKSPGQFGITERFKACCGLGDPYNFDVFATCGTPSASACKNPSQYINWDGVHLTEGMYKVVSDMFLKGRFSHPPFSYLLDKKLRQGWGVLGDDCWFDILVKLVNNIVQ